MKNWQATSTGVGPSISWPPKENKKADTKCQMQPADYRLQIIFNGTHVKSKNTNYDQTVKPWNK